jgi:hypothetical protein
MKKNFYENMEGFILNEQELKTKKLNFLLNTDNNTTANNNHIPDNFRFIIDYFV